MNTLMDTPEYMPESTFTETNTNDHNHTSADTSEIQPENKTTLHQTPLSILQFLPFLTALKIPLPLIFNTLINTYISFTTR